MRRDHRPLLASTIAAIAVAIAPLTADAFCRTRTIPAPPDFEGCFEQGALLYHPSQCVPYHLLAAESPKIPRATLSNSLARAFGAWTAPNAICSPGITAIELAPVTDTKIADYKVGEHGHNVIGVVDGPWPHGSGPDTLALTTLTFNADTGEVYDADMEIRSDMAWSFTAKPPADGYDLDATLTHEAGHFLGLSHSAATNAVMFPTYTPGSITQRTLADDDARGICAIYPDRQTRSLGATLIASTPCDLSATPGTSGGTCPDPAITHGCAVGANVARSPRDASDAARTATWLAALGLLVTSARAWHRRRATRPR
jgi:hypothetical protein